MLSKPSPALDPAPDGTFSIVVIPDTQIYMVGNIRAHKVPEGETVTNPTLDATTRWIVDNIERQKIVFVSHTGDVVDEPDHREWRVGRAHMDRLHGVIPYAISPGNHDTTREGDSSLFQEYFPAERFLGFDWYAGYYAGDPSRPGYSGNNANSVQLYSAGDVRFVHFHLECNAPDEVLAWAQGVADQHRDRHMIVSTHMDLGIVERSEVRVPGAKRGRMTWSKRHLKRGNSGQQLWDKFFRYQPNLFLILSADQVKVSAVHQSDRGEHGNMVHALMADYTKYTGPLRILRIDPAAGKIKVITYDPMKDALVTTTERAPEEKWHQFELRHDFRRIHQTMKAPPVSKSSWLDRLLQSLRLQ